MKVVPTAIEGVVILEPEVFGDARGYFFESYSQRRFDAEVRPVRFVQDNESHSRYGVLRGLHFQKGRYSQSKLVRVVRGRVLDVAVDIRRGSPTFGRHVAVELTEDNKRQFFIPRGFAIQVRQPLRPRIGGRHCMERPVAGYRLASGPRRCRPLAQGQRPSAAVGGRGAVRL